MSCRPPPAAGARIRSTAALLCAALAGCTVGPDYRTPAVAPQAGYAPGPLPTVLGSGSAGPAAGDQALAIGRDVQGDWWTLFHSRPLNDLVALGLHNNPSLAAAQATLLQADELVRAERGSLFPAISAAFGASRQKSSAASFGGASAGVTTSGVGTSTGTGTGTGITTGTGTGNTTGTGTGTTTSTSTTTATSGSSYNFFNATLTVSYALDLWGGERRYLEQLNAQADDQRFALEAAYLTLTGNIVGAVIAQASLQAQIAATQQVLQAERDGLRIVAAQLAAGAVTRAELLQQQTQLLTTEATLPPLQSQLVQERNLLATYVGAYPTGFVVPEIDFDSLTLPSSLPVSLPSALVMQRPDLRRADAVLHQQTAAIGVATAALLPQVTLNASLGSDALQLAQLFAPGTYVYSLAGQIAQQVFQGGTLVHRRRAAIAAAQAAAATYRNTAIGAFANVSDALLALQYDADTLRIATQASDAARASLAVAQAQYVAGAIGNLAVLTAQQAEQTARLALARAQAARFADTAALFVALGGGWWNRTDVALPPPRCCALIR